ncbi:uncharacterized protein B0H18DRAFT_1060048, partial [Fomitopsis serialis]|uniref:uncharacterized protein n=1 Tax=Fomitopsis serialis TaxID=139415 RepID=UPI0020079EBE
VIHLGRSVYGPFGSDSGSAGTHPATLSMRESSQLGLICRRESSSWPVCGV